MRCDNIADVQYLIVRRQDGEETRLSFNVLLCTVGRAPRADGFGLDELDCAIAAEVARGCVKALTMPDNDRIPGVAIVGEHASDLLAEFVLAMRHSLGLNKIPGAIHTYPTWSEANKYVAGEWKHTRAPQFLLKWAEKYHAKRRGKKGNGLIK